MSLGNILLVVFLIGRSQCYESFTTVGNSKMLIVEEKLPFFEAEEICRDKGSALVEFWNEDEWKEVSGLKIKNSELPCCNAKVFHFSSSFG